MKNFFRPEFLGRLDGLVPFSELKEDSMVRIFEIHFRKLNRRVENLGIKMEITDAAKEHIAKAGFSPEFGARPLIREIKQQLSQPLSTLLIKGELAAGDRLLVGVDKNHQLTWDITKKET